MRSFRMPRTRSAVWNLNFHHRGWGCGLYSEKICVLPQETAFLHRCPHLNHRGRLHLRISFHWLHASTQTAKDGWAVLLEENSVFFWSITLVGGITFFSRTDPVWRGGVESRIDGGISKSEAGRMKPKPSTKQ